MNNRLWNCKNPCQGDSKKVLCVCSAGLLRSPTAAKIIWRDFGHNTRACGIDEDHASIPIDDVLIEWADEVVCMTTDQEKRLVAMGCKNIKCLHISDNYAYMDSYLCDEISKRYGSNS